MLPPYAKLRRLPGAVPVEPLTLEDAKLYLNLDTPDTNAQVQDLIVAARGVCEAKTNLGLVASSWQLTIDGFYVNSWSRNSSRAYEAIQYSWCCFDDVIELPESPLVAVQSVQYLGQDNTLHTLDPSAYLVSPGTPGRIEPPFGSYWPFTEPEIGAVNIVFTTGFGEDATKAACVRQAMRLLVSHAFTYRATDAPIPEAVDRVLDPVRFYGYA